MDGIRSLGKKTLIDYFHFHVRKQPEKVCLVDPSTGKPSWVRNRSGLPMQN